MFLHASAQWEHDFKKGTGKGGSEEKGSVSAQRPTEGPQGHTLEEEATMRHQGAMTVTWDTLSVRHCASF